VGRFERVEGYENLRRERTTGTLYVHKYKAGRGRLMESTRTKSLSRARAYADTRISDWLTGSRGALSRVPSVSDVCRELKAYLRKEVEAEDRRPRTWEQDQTYLELLRRYFGHVRISEIDEDWWDTWVQFEGRRKNRTLFDVAKYLSKVLTFAHRKKYITRKPTIRNPDAKHKKVDRILSRDALKELREAADPVSALYLVLCYECGLRTSEARCMRWDWLDESDEGLVLTLPESFVKANPRSLVVSDTAAKLLRYRRADSRSPWVFPGVTGTKPETMVQACRRFKKLTARVGVKGVTLYSLRHAFFTRCLLELSLPIQAVSEYGGTSIKTLQKHYLHGSAQRTAHIANKLRIEGV
jgi:integrase